MAQSVSFSGSDKTLVITASGDLTNYTMSDDSKKEFTSDATSAIAKDEKGSKVYGGEVYSSSSTYYYLSYTYKQIFDGKAPGEQQENSTKWGGSLRTWTNNGTIGYEVYEADLFVSHDGGKTKEQLQYNKQYTYTDGDLFYEGTQTWTKIDDNDSYFQENSKYLKTITQTFTFVQAVEKEMDAGGYTSFKFVKKDGAAITISKDQMQSLLNNYANTNKAYLLDFSQISGITASEMPIGPSAYSHISWVLPNDLADSEKATVGAKATNANMIWFSDLDGKPSVNIHVTNDTELSFLPEAVATENSYLPEGEANKIKNIIVTGSVVNVTKEMMKNFDIQYTDNLDLHNAEVNPNITPEWFGDDQYLNRVIFPNSFGDISNWYTTYSSYTSSNSSCKIFQKILNGTNGEKNTLQSILMSPGRLTTTEHYYHKDFSDCIEMDFYGAANKSDFNFMSGIDIERLNLANLSYTDDIKSSSELKTVLDGIKNSKIKYWALPDADMKVEDDAVDFAMLYANNSSLIGVGQYVKYTDESGNEVKEFLGRTTEGGVIKILTAMIGDTKTEACSKLLLSGNVNAIDLGNGELALDENNHLKTTLNNDGTASLGEGTYKTGAFTNCHFTDVDLSRIAPALNGTTTEELEAAQNDLSLSLYGNYGGMTSLKLPTDKNFYTIPTSGLNIQASLTSLCIPGNFKNIMGYAFQDDYALTHIYTTAVDAEGNGTGDVIDHGELSVTLPEHLKLIKKGAFYNVKKFKDVYVLGTDASALPVCEQDAFDKQTYVGNDGFAGTANVKAATQEMYKTDDGAYFAILHYPANAGDEVAKAYTDITKKYQYIADGTMATDGDGNLIYWPDQREWRRVYNQAVGGVTWNKWKDSGHNWGSSDPFSGEATNTSSALFESRDDETAFENKYPNYMNDASATYDASKYAGWHQFVLSMTYQPNTPDPVFNITKFKENDWYTICLPFNMTKKMLAKAFGQYTTASDGTITVTKYPNVCTLSSVKRTVSGKAIILYMTKDLCDNTENQTWDFDKKDYKDYEYKDADNVKASDDDDDPIVMYAGYPYLIKPSLPEDVIKELAENGLKRTIAYKATSAARVDGNALPVITYKSTASTDPDDSHATENAKVYSFMGRYRDTEIPQYSYYIGKASSGAHKFFRHDSPNSKIKDKDTGTEKPTWVWNSYSCMIGVASTGYPKQDKEKVYVTPEDYIEVPVVVLQTDDDPLINKKGQSMQAKPNMSFEDPTATGVNKVVMVMPGSDSKRIYNLNGRCVSTDGNIDALPQGIYIMGGKKYVVR